MRGTQVSSNAARATPGATAVPRGSRSSRASVRAPAARSAPAGATHVSAHRATKRRRVRRPPAASPARASRLSTRSHLALLYAVNEMENSAQTTTTDACSQQIRASRRGGYRVTPSSNLIVHKRPAQLRSPRKPLSRLTDRTTELGQQPSTPQFHAPSSERRAASYGHTRFLRMRSPRRRRRRRRSSRGADRLGHETPVVS